MTSLHSLCGLAIALAVAAQPIPHGETPARDRATRHTDLEAWFFWWQFNWDEFVQIKAAVYGSRRPSPVVVDDRFRRAGNVLRPTTRQVVREILPALDRTLAGTADRDLIESCMIAMAKVGRWPEDFDVLARFRQRLAADDQEIRETAALAMGISRRADAVPDLTALVLDAPRGRELVQRTEVHLRTRAFAAYGLGLIGAAAWSPEVDDAVFQALRRVLRGGKSVPMDLAVAAVHAISILGPDPTTDAGVGLLESCLDLLQQYAELELDPAAQIAQAHVPTAVAKLCRSPEVRAIPKLGTRCDEFRRTWLGLVTGATDANPLILQSAIIALGRTTGPEPTESELDRTISRALRTASTHVEDLQARCFALMALGQIGGADNRQELLDRLHSETPPIEREWVALSLGVLAFHQRAALGADAPVDAAIGARLLQKLRGARSPNYQSALALALGLCGYRPASNALLDLLEKKPHQDELAGHLCISLALLKGQGAFEKIRGVLTDSMRRPDLLKHAAIALGKLNDKSAQGMLTQRLDEDRKNLAMFSAVASALGSIGDRRSLQPLIATLEDDSLSPLTRAFVVVALGEIANKELMPWNAAYAANINYRAAVPTLTDRCCGVLDIL